MTDEERHLAERTKREFEQTDEAFTKLRAAWVQRLFATEVRQSDEREKLYLAVVVLDEVRKTMIEIIRSASDTNLIDQYADAFRKQGRKANG